MLVLQVEDDAITAQAVELMLKSEGHDCETASLGEEAVRLAQEKDYDLILLDIMLPDIDGYDVLRRMRACNVCAPVVILSALVAHDRDRAGLGVSESLLKPFNKAELNASIFAATATPKPDGEVGAAEAAEDSAQERRSAARTNRIKYAEIVFDDERSNMDCLVLNHSDSGATIQPADMLNLPDRFTLQLKLGLSYECQVCWRHGTKLGVHFLNN